MSIRILQLLLFSILLQTTQGIVRTFCPVVMGYEQSHYYKPGDLIVGGNLLPGSFQYTNAPEFHSLYPLKFAPVLVLVSKRGIWDTLWTALLSD